MRGSRRHRWLQLRYRWTARLTGGEPEMRAFLRRICKDFGLQRDEIPSRDGVSVISGEWNGHRGPVESLTGITLAQLQTHQSDFILV